MPFFGVAVAMRVFFLFKEDNKAYGFLPIKPMYLTNSAKRAN